MNFVAIVAVVALVIGFTLDQIALRRQRRIVAAKDAELTGLRNEAKRRAAALTEVVTPLSWAWDEFGAEGDSRLRHHLTQALVTVQGGLAADDVEMTDRMAEVPDAPRRLPRYPQVPPFLATPEDVAQVPAAMARDLQPEAEVPLHPPCAVCGSPTIDSSGWESPPIICTNPECPTNQPPEVLQRPPRDPFAGMDQ